MHTEWHKFPMIYSSPSLQDIFPAYLHSRDIHKALSLVPPRRPCGRKYLVRAQQVPPRERWRSSSAARVLAHSLSLFFLSLFFLSLLLTILGGAWSQLKLGPVGTKFLQRLQTKLLWVPPATRQGMLSGRQGAQIKKGKSPSFLPRCVGFRSTAAPPYLYRNKNKKLVRKK